MATLGQQALQLGDAGEPLEGEGEQPAPKTTHPFFMKTSEKKAEIERRKEQAAKIQAQVETRSPSPAPTDEDDPSLSRTKRQRAKAKHEPRPTKRSRSVRSKQPVVDPTPPTSSPVLIQSVCSEIDPVTAAAPSVLTPSSSPPSIPGHSSVEAEAEVDMNQDRRKRRKITPPVAARPPTHAVVAFGVDVNGRVLDASERFDTPVSFQKETGRLIIRLRNGLQRDSAQSSPLPPSSPVFPTNPPNDASASSPPTAPSESCCVRVSANFDAESGIFTIRSSPPPPEPPEPTKKSLFDVLGKKKDVEKPEPKERMKQTAQLNMEQPSPGSTDTDSRASSKVSKRKASSKNRKPPVKAKKDPIVIDDMRQDSQQDERTEMPPEKVQALVQAAHVEAPKTAVPDAVSTTQTTLSVSKKPLHPFFSAAGRKKLAQAAPVAPPVEGTETQKTDIDPPPKPKRPLPDSKHLWAFTANFGSAGDKDTPFSSQKPVGGIEASWPLRGAVHVRGDTNVDPPSISLPSNAPRTPRGRKLKECVTIPEAENILHKLAVELCVPELGREIASETYSQRKWASIAPEVRLPERIVTVGSKLQHMVRAQVSERLPHPNATTQLSLDFDSDSGSDVVLHSGDVHASTLRLYLRLREELTAFDRFACETVPWEVKYAPTTTAQVLQPAREMSILKKWLLGLRTQRPEVPQGKRKATQKPGVAKKKRKKKDDGLEGFVVMSEEELDMMDEITDPEDDDWLNPTSKAKGSIMRYGDKDIGLDELLGPLRDSKKTNTVLISGPCGCGKTAAVYAAAKELNFAVFEVSPGVRRAGKDVADQVGDMSRNHLVHQAKTMQDAENPFSRAKTVAQEELIRMEEEAEFRQQQSLILLEEVDILFEEDRTFWSTVVNLMSKSKRPIIMTCNDESLLPFEDLSLHAVLRFRQPPIDLIVDQLVLICANEGHLLERPAVESLVRVNGRDIRSSIMDLQFFCRIGVGDRTGCMKWWRVRFPPGCDRDENGETERVVSIHTYGKGMGWLERSQHAKDEHKWQDVYEEFGLDVGASHDLMESICSVGTHKPAIRMGVLKATSAFFDALSASDAFAGDSMVTDHQKCKLDHNYPKRTETHKVDDIVGYTILQTNDKVIPGSLALKLSTSVRCLSRQCLTSQVAEAPSESIASSYIVTSVESRRDNPPLTSSDVQDIFAPLAKSQPLLASTPMTTNSVVYPGYKTLITEVAPHVRSIFRYDALRERRRREESNLLSVGGKRRTRSSRFAGSMGDRARRERWLPGLDASVLRTSGDEWERALEMWVEETNQEMQASTVADG